MPSLAVKPPASRDERLKYAREYALLRVMQMQGKGALSSEVRSVFGGIVCSEAGV